MKQITLHNYEEFFMDYFDDNLSFKESEALYAFLDEHPELAEEFNAFENVQLSPPLESNTLNKCSLKIEFPIHLDNQDEYFIAHLEGDLTNKEEGFVNEYLEFYPEQKDTFNTFQKVKLTPIEEDVFPNSSILKHNEAKLIALYWKPILAVAASIALLFILFRPYQKQQIYFATTEPFQSIDKFGLNNEIVKAFHKAQPNENKLNDNASSNDALNENTALSSTQVKIAKSSLAFLTRIPVKTIKPTTSSGDIQLTELAAIRYAKTDRSILNQPSKPTTLEFAKTEWTKQFEKLKDQANEVVASNGTIKTVKNQLNKAKNLKNKLAGKDGLLTWVVEMN